MFFPLKFCVISTTFLGLTLASITDLPTLLEYQWLKHNGYFQLYHNILPHPTIILFHAFSAWNFQL